MKVYFSVSLSRMNDQVRNSCTRITTCIEKMGHQIISNKLFLNQEVPYRSQTREESLLVQKNLTKLKKQADIVVFEASYPTIAIGQELNLALSLNKPVIVLFEEGKEPHILRDEGGDLLITVPYSVSRSDVEKELKGAFDYAAENQDVRFNFFISPRIGNYLDWISHSKKIPRSVYLRSLIEKDIAKHPEYEM